ncbi:beta-galactosidase-1-like protein isoform X2 [Anolis carolinensis]|uniref:beta-galactosidase-1-like protein isoform X2 n=1 Tax=Anolis carolinensis TaxID=28377 RepID=UPI0007DB7061|nr:PREDICTED: beta-galactosidase-1-like protein isoform X2 [Anolis carolinensis]|eukprot:XP_016850300.1 PREDICTED: beta-galactosidase-1-like protein isoform X2 [Anolis carolinensis]
MNSYSSLAQAEVTTKEMGLWLCVLVLVLRGLRLQPSAAAPSFSIDYTDKCFLKDGVKFRYISGSIHYFRIPRAYWKDRLLKMYMSGLNAVQIYIPWNYHEPLSGVYNFDGDRDLEGFLDLAANFDLLVILRPGPYICAEWEMGGIPSWLLAKPNIILRTSDPGRWRMNMGATMPVTTTICATWRLSFVPTWAKKLCSSPPMAPKSLNCYVGHCTVFIQLWTLGQVNSEYYTGWLDYWGEPHSTKSAEDVARGLEKMLELGANVNMYMFQGGTNFGYWSGADYNNGIYNPITTSYDYDAPLSEAGDPTDKLYAIRTVIGKFQVLPAGPMPPPTPKFAYGYVFLPQCVALLDILGLLSPSLPFYSSFPATFEALKQPSGFMLYRTFLPHDILEPVVLSAPEDGIHDLAYILLNGVYKGTLERNKINGINISGQLGDTLDLLVESMGHINFGANESDFKGLVKNLTLGSNIVTDWLIYPLGIDKAVSHSWPPVAPLSNGTGPAFYTGFFTTLGIAQDSFVKFPGWNKGQIWINGFNLGRFWPTRGPQQTLFVPGSILSSSTINTVVVLELQNAPEKPKLLFLDRPLLNGTQISTHKNQMQIWL